MRFQLVLVAAVAAAVGCSGSDGPQLPEGPKGQVTGKVTYNGSPVPAGSVVNFAPLDEDGIAAVGTVASDGSYELSSRGASAVVPGKYAVIVSAPSAVTDTSDEEAMRRLYENGEAEAKKDPFPSRYTQVATSGLEFDVAEGEQTIDIELKDD